jgi:hypothetical protein
VERFLGGFSEGFRGALGVTGGFTVVIQFSYAFQQAGQFQ